LLTLPKGARVLPPCKIDATESDAFVAVISNEGRLLIFPLTELPELARGKGNKMLSIPAARVQAREEFVIACDVVQAHQKLTIYSGKRHTVFKMSDLEHYLGERGRRGNKLPRGFQKVDGIEVL